MHPLRSCNLCRETQKIHPVFTKNKYLIVRCENCGLVYVDAIPTSDELRAIYGGDFFTLSAKFKGGETGPAFQNAKIRVDRILSLPGVGREAWLDVGCATGEFVAQAQRHIGEVVGVELSEFAVQQAKAQYGVTVLNGDFLTTELDPGRYDVITAWDFIEHVQDPAATLEKMHRLLRPGGCLILSTGDIASISSRLAGKFWHLMIPPKHLYFFSKDTIRTYLERAGFLDINISYPGKYVPLDFIVWKFFAQISSNSGRRVASALERINLGKLVLPVNLFDIMEVQARKP